MTAGAGGLNYWIPMELWSSHGYMYPTLSRTPYASRYPVEIKRKYRLGVQSTRSEKSLIRTPLWLSVLGICMPALFVRVYFRAESH